MEGRSSPILISLPGCPKGSWGDTTRHSEHREWEKLLLVTIQTPQTHPTGSAGNSDLSAERSNSSCANPPQKIRVMCSFWKCGQARWNLQGASRPCKKHFLMESRSPKMLPAERNKTQIECKQLVFQEGGFPRWVISGEAFPRFSCPRSCP